MKAMALRTLNKRELLLLFAVAFGFLFFLAYRVFWPNWKAARTIKEEIAQIETKLSLLDGQKKDIEVAFKSEQKKIPLEDISEHILSGSVVEDIFTLHSQFALQQEENGTKFIDASLRFYAEIKDLIGFAEHLERLRPAIKINEFVIARDEEKTGFLKTQIAGVIYDE